MADIRKEQEREELHKAIWSIADDLRGSVDGWDFKQYVLGMMFYRYISENLTNYINAGEREAGDTDFDYAKLSDEEAESAREGLVQEKGFFILPSELFSNVRSRAKDDENLNSCISILFVPLRAIWCFFGALVPTLFPYSFRLFVVAVVVKKVLSRKGAFQRLPREDSFCVL